MMDYEKMSTFYASSTKLTQPNCLTLPQKPTALSPHASLSTTPPSFKLGQAVSSNAFLAVPHTNTNNTNTLATTTTTSDPYSTYADNFDLSLLPQDCASSPDNIPTIVYHYSENNKKATTAPPTPTTPTIGIPTVKIEQLWSNSPCPVDEIKQEPLTPSPHQLIPPPPPYPSSIYPSPQSSPAQSEYCFPQSQFASCYDSISSSRSSLYPSSPYPSLDASSIKQELHILPPSPPESNCETPSPHSSWPDIKSEPIEADVEMLIDLNALLEKKDYSGTYESKPHLSSMPAAQVPQQLKQQQQQQQQQLQQSQQSRSQQLCDFLENSTFQLGGIEDMEEVNGNIEQVISKALEDTKSQAVEICAKLQISQDPTDWSVTQVHAWLRSTIAQFKLPQIEDLELKFREDGAALIQLTEEEFKRRAPESGSDLHAQLEVWRYHFNSNAPDSDDEDDILPPSSVLVNSSAATHAANGIRKPEGEPKRPGRNGGSHIHLWQFLKELLAEPHCYGTAIRWIDRGHGIFKIEDSVRVAKLWGNRKNRPAMNYDKLSRSIRQYYKKGIMKKTERSQRLVYQFCVPYQH